MQSVTDLVKVLREWAASERKTADTTPGESHAVSVFRSARHAAASAYEKAARLIEEAEGQKSGESD